MQTVLGVDAILFDLYGTLAWPDWSVLDSGPVGIGAAGERRPARLAEQWRITHAERMRGAHESLEGDLRAMLQACGAAAPDALLAELAQMELLNWRQGVRLYPDALATLRRLRRRGVRLALVSNASREAASAVLGLGLDREIDAAVFSCDVGTLKPDVALLRLALDQVDTRPRQTLLVDDAAENLDAARSLGMQAVLIQRDGTETVATAHPSIRTLDELLAPPFSGFSNAGRRAL